jgi:serine phosphatase RsbU (regulator of sigma subunit)
LAVVDNNLQNIKNTRGLCVSPFFVLRRLFLVLGFLIFPIFSFPSTREIDSLIAIIKSPTENDTSYVSALLSLGETIYMNNPDSALLLFRQARDYASKKLETEQNGELKRGLLLHLSTAYNNIGFIYSIKGDILKSLDNYMKSLYFRRKINNKNKISYSLINIGYVYYSLGDLPKALDYFTEALKLKEELHDTAGIIVANNNIAHIFSMQKNYEKALRMYEHSLKLAEMKKDTSRMALMNNNMGVTYMKINKYDSALYYLRKSLMLNMEIKNDYEIAYNYHNLGKLFSDYKNVDSSLYYLKKAEQIRIKINDKSGLCETYSIVANDYLLLGDLKNAEKYGLLAYNISKELGYPDLIQISSELLSKIYLKKQDYKNAYKYFSESVEMNDSLVNKKNQQDLYQQQAKYQYEKKAAIDSLNHIKEIKIKNLEIKRQATQRNFLIVGLILTLLVVFIIYRNYKQKSEMNLLLREQNEEIKSQRDEINEQKKIIENIYNELSQSINYARNLQITTLPSHDLLQGTLADFFVFYRPKDKVSGDFYWWVLSGNNLIIAMADCTGHGVPGAFMSMLGVTLLREIVYHNKVTDTAAILRVLRKEIVSSLKQKGNLYEQKDGIDMSIVNLNLNDGNFQYSGANNPIYLLTSDELNQGNEKIIKRDELCSEGKYFYELKPDKMPVGIYHKMDKFTSISLKINKGDIFYMFSDGFADQFGGNKGKKFKYKRLRELLLSISHLPMNEQLAKIEKTFDDWKKNYEQIDDVSLGGFKF